jgi:hypothetical protein
MKIYFRTGENLHRFLWVFLLVLGVSARSLRSLGYNDVVLQGRDRARPVPTWRRDVLLLLHLPPGKVESRHDDRSGVETPPAQLHVIVSPSKWFPNEKK